MVRPAFSTQRNVLCKIVLEVVTMMPSISNLTPIIPRGSCISSKPSTMNCFGMTFTISLSGGIESTCAASITLCTSPSVISRFSLWTATTPWHGCSIT
ncbi:hypothetical protein BCO26_1023 [Heyndrickxia coagulans 2-6]|nr:hypothetical protein BCO26_1023 [Heyndrickxia coagulans 2-6]